LDLRALAGVKAEGRLSSLAAGALGQTVVKRVALSIALACFLMTAPAAAEDARSFPNDQIATGAELYAVNCSPCHGARMEDPGAAFNLRKFPPDQRERFVNAVTRGRNQMPPWGDFFKPDQLQALWAYVVAGER
jgi:mono/diheme cytochrome c family protein